MIILYRSQTLSQLDRINKISQDLQDFLAINASVLTAMERTADKVAKLAEEIRKGAER
jgi:hypothetical protein